MTDATVEIVLNGQSIEIPEAETISYEELCKLEGLDPKHNPSVIYSTLDGRDGILRHGKSIDLMVGTIFSVMDTGNA